MAVAVVGKGSVAVQAPSTCFRERPQCPGSPRCPDRPRFHSGDSAGIVFRLPDPPEAMLVHAQFPYQAPVQTAHGGRPSHTRGGANPREGRKLRGQVCDNASHQPACQTGMQRNLIGGLHEGPQRALRSRRASRRFRTIASTGSPPHGHPDHGRTGLDPGRQHAAVRAGPSLLDKHIRPSPARSAESTRCPSKLNRIDAASHVCAICNKAHYPRSAIGVTTHLCPQGYEPLHLKDTPRYKLIRPGPRRPRHRQGLG